MRSIGIKRFSSLCGLGAAFLFVNPFAHAAGPAARSSAPTQSATPAYASPPPQNPSSIRLSYGRGATGAVTTIGGLNWNSVRSKVEMQDSEPLALIYGNYTKVGRSLVCSGKRVTIEAGGNFRIAFHPQKSRETLKLISIGTHGEIEQEVLVVDMPGLPTLIKQASAPAVASGAGSISLGAGFTYLSYQETTIPQFNETAITAKLALQRPWSAGSPWDIGLSAYATLVPISTTSALKDTIQFLGGNARIGYRLPFLAEPWKLSFMLGVYLTTTSSSDGTFGFTNLMGPELYPVLRRRFANGSLITAYFKYSPVGSGLSLTFASRELAAGLYYTPLSLGSHPISITLDLADLKATIEGTSYESTSTTLGVSFGL